MSKKNKKKTARKIISPEDFAEARKIKDWAKGKDLKTQAWAMNKIFEQFGLGWDLNPVKAKAFQTDPKPVRRPKAQKKVVKQWVKKEK